MKTVGKIIGAIVIICLILFIAVRVITPQIVYSTANSTEGSYLITFKYNAKVMNIINRLPWFIMNVESQIRKYCLKKNGDFESGCHFSCDTSTCHLPYPDAGKVCVDTSECTGICIPTESVLHESTPYPEPEQGTSNSSDWLEWHLHGPKYICEENCKGYCSKYSTDVDRYGNQYYIEDGKIFWNIQYQT